MGSALVLIFWAYVGFELVTVPSDEIKDAKKTIPKAIILGMGVIIIFYLVTNLVILGAVPWMELSTSSAPLSLAGSALLGGFGAILLTVGALFSISGSDEAGILSSARIPYAMAGDGLLPGFFARVHPEYGTPYVALALQGIFTGVASILGSISQLIILSVFTLLFCYLITSLAVFPLKKKYDGGINLPWLIPVLGVVISLYMMTQCKFNEILTGVLIIVLGIPIYVKYSPGEEIKSVKREIELGRGIFARWIRAPDRFLVHFLRRLAVLIRKIRLWVS
nr:amino acid permease [Methanobacterium formicicum]